MEDYKTVKLSKVLEIWESFHGWYWFITEFHDGGQRAFGLVKGFEIEWGYIWMPDLEELRSRNLAWKVHRQDWSVCPCVVE